MENEFYIMFPKLSNFEDILKELDPVCASLYVQRETQDLNELMQWMQVFPYLTMKQFSVIMREPTPSQPTSGLLGVMRPARRLVERTSLGHFYWDNTMVGHIRQFYKNRRYTAHFVLAMNIFLDCVHTCRHANIQRSYQKMKAGMAEAFPDVEWYIKDKFHYLFSIAENAFRGPSSSLLSQQGRDLRAELRHRRHVLLRPLDVWFLAALSTGRDKNFGVHVVNGTGFFLTMAHLHNAIVAAGRMDPIEPVQRIIDALKRRLFCVSDLPRTPWEFLTALCFSLGVKPESIARNKHDRKGRALKYHSEGKGLEDDSLYYHFGRYGKLNKEWEDKLAVFSVQSSPSIGSKKDNQKEEEEEEKREAEINTSCEALVRLERLKAYLQSPNTMDLIRLNFFALHRFSMDVIHNVYADTQAELCLAINASELIEHAYQMPYVVGYLFLAAMEVPLTPLSLMGSIWAKAAQAFQSVASSWDTSRFYWSRSGV
ncbi:hypothetical protein QOT17_021826 [Balamuthia mandrillaris]